VNPWRRARLAPLIAIACIAIGTTGCDSRITNIGELDHPTSSSADAGRHIDAGRRSDGGLGVYLEAESGVLSGGFEVGKVSTASGGQFIFTAIGASFDDAPGSARAEYALDAPVTGTYLIWGRIHSPNIDENRFWFQVDGSDWVKWRVTTGDTWFWDPFHDNVDYGTPLTFELSAGAHALVIANAVDGTELDRLYFAPDRTEPAGNDTPCNPPHSIPLDGGECTPSCGSLGGSCGGVPCTGVTTFATYDCPACCIPEQ
jgi:hypothetical protein